MNQEDHYYIDQDQKYNSTLQKYAIVKGYCLKSSCRSSGADCPDAMPGKSCLKHALEKGPQI